MKALNRKEHKLLADGSPRSDSTESDGSGSFHGMSVNKLAFMNGMKNGYPGKYQGNVGFGMMGIPGMNNNMSKMKVENGTPNQLGNPLGLYGSPNLLGTEGQPAKLARMGPKGSPISPTGYQQHSPTAQSYTQQFGFANNFAANFQLQNMNAAAMALQNAATAAFLAQNAQHSAPVGCGIQSGMNQLPCQATSQSLIPFMSPAAFPLNSLPSTSAGFFMPPPLHSNHINSGQYSPTGPSGPAGLSQQRSSSSDGTYLSRIFLSIIYIPLFLDMYLN